MQVYLPIGVLTLVAMAVLFATAADRQQQWARFGGGVVRAFGRGGQVAARRWVPAPSRAVLWLVLLYFLSYLWTYQRVQDAIAVQLASNDLAQVEVGSLIIPYSSFFRTAYTVDAGFSKSKKRTRVEVVLRGHVWSGFDVRIEETGLARINQIASKKFVFSYLTDVKVLRPAIQQHMDQLVSGKQIDRYAIETFDNRGPYLIVVLNSKHLGSDPKTIATSLAQGLHTNLTKSRQLKVNRVVVKVVEAEPYLGEGIINVIGRGTAGNY